MARKSGFALLAALVAVIALVCTAVVAGIGDTGTAADDAGRRPRPGATAAARAAAGSWAGTWAASPAAGEPGTPDGYPGSSVRNVLHTSIGGTAVRVQLSNLFGTAPLTLGHVTVAVAAGGGGPDAVPGTLAALEFGGRSGVTVPAGASVVSDAARIRVPAGCDLLVSTYSPTPSGPVTYHPHARQTSFLATGDRTADTEGTGYTRQSTAWRYVTAVDVWSNDATGSVVALGDSITDGVTATTGADHRWPDYLAQRLATSEKGPRLGVLNEGISGNRVLTPADPVTPQNGPSALSRLERDALGRTGVKVLVVDLGINDIMERPRRTTAPALVAGLRRITREAHAHGIRVVGCTLTPFGGQRTWTPVLEAERRQVDAAIRAGGVFDTVVDFDRVLRDPARPDRLLPRYDSGDHLHPSDAGFRAMADAVPLAALDGQAPASL